MNKTNDLEKSILSCLLIKPELMEQLILEDKHFVKNQRMWQFMKAFYNKFKTFDIQLMASVCKDKWQIVNYIIMLLDYEVVTCNFDKYQKQLIELYEESKKEKWIIDKIYELANNLYVRNIELKDFDYNLKKIYEDADKIFKEGNIK